MMVPLFKIVDTFIMLAEGGGVWKNDDRGKRTWTKPERNERVKLSWWVRHFFAVRIKESMQMDVISIYAEYTFNFWKWEFNEASPMTPYL